VLWRAGLPSHEGHAGNWAALLALATLVERPSPRPLGGLKGASGREQLTPRDRSWEDHFYCKGKTWANLLLTKRDDTVELGTALCRLVRHYHCRPGPLHAQRLLEAASSLLTRAVFLCVCVCV
jgi:hypothetical protein